MNGWMDGGRKRADKRDEIIVDALHSFRYSEWSTACKQAGRHLLNMSVGVYERGEEWGKQPDTRVLKRISLAIQFPTVLATFTACARIECCFRFVPDPHFRFYFLGQQQVTRRQVSEGQRKTQENEQVFIDVVVVVVVVDWLPDKAFHSMAF